MKQLIAFTFTVLFSISLSAQTISTMADERDGKTYEITKIGDKWWMSDILKFEPESGYKIADAETFTSGNRAGCIIYNWTTAQDVCPAGWLLPTKEDYIKILNEYGFGKIDQEDLYDKIPGALNAFTWTSSNVNEEKAYLYYVVFNAAGKLVQVLESSKESFYTVKCMTSGEHLLDQHKKNPNNIELLKNLTNLYLSDSNYNEALVFINKAIAIDSKNKYFFYARGFVYDNLEKYDEATLNYSTAIELDPDYFDALYSIGICNYNMAAKIYNKDIDGNTFDQVNYFLRKALPYIEKASKLQPYNENLANIKNTINQQLDTKK